MNPILRIHLSIAVSISPVLAQSSVINNAIPGRDSSPRLIVESGSPIEHKLDDANPELLLLSRVPRTYTESEKFCQQVCASLSMNDGCETAIWSNQDLIRQKNFEVLKKLSIWTSPELSTKDKAMVVFFYQPKRGISYLQNKILKNSVVCRISYRANAEKSIALNN